MKSILIVDDDRAVIEALAMKLTGHYRTHATHDPRRAVEMARNHHPDLVLCDVDMPGMNGPDVAAALRREFPQLPLVFLTGLMTPAETKDPIKGQRYFAKSAPVEELISTIQSLIGR